MGTGELTRAPIIRRLGGEFRRCARCAVSEWLALDFAFVFVRAEHVERVDHAAAL